eukprot:5394392-Prorocentrum_lima.AAC.1
MPARDTSEHCCARPVRRWGEIHRRLEAVDHGTMMRCSPKREREAGGYHRAGQYWERRGSIIMEG